MATDKPASTDRSVYDHHLGRGVGLADTHSTYIRGMFSRIAGRYDLMNRVMSFGLDQRWRRIAALAADVPAGGLALDLGAGTGDLALAIAGHSKARTVIAADFSIDMLRYGREKIRPSAYGGLIHLTSADALALPFGDETFDCVAQAFMLRNLADLAAGLAEIRRVLKPGGKLASLELVKRERDLYSPLVECWGDMVIPLLGRLVTGDAGAYRYLPASARRFLTAGQLAHAVQEAGLVNVRWRSFALGSVALHIAQKPA